MSWEYGLQLVVIACFLPGQLLARGFNARDPRCLQAVTVEGCETVLLGWSFIKASNKCAKGFVCSDNINRFSNQAECTQLCPPIPGRRPRIRIRNCRYWLREGGECQKHWFGFRKDFFGVKRRVLYYTGCDSDQHRHFAYDFFWKRCREVRRPSSETGQ
nr:uncharacterized protein LOC126543133 [Dermacentor andersoni]